MALLSAGRFASVTERVFLRLARGARPRIQWRNAGDRGLARVGLQVIGHGVLVGSARRQILDVAFVGLQVGGQCVLVGRALGQVSEVLSVSLQVVGPGVLVRSARRDVVMAEVMFASLQVVGQSVLVGGAWRDVAELLAIALGHG
jgi:hypothetical protein